MAPVGSHLESRRRAHAALNLRSRMRTWQEIADALDFKTAQGARLAVVRLRQREAPTPEERRAESVEEGRVTRRMLHDAGEDAQRRGDSELVVKCANAIRASLDSEALRCGLNAPVRTELDVKVDPGQVFTAYFAELKAGSRPALPVLSERVIEAAEVVS